MTTLPNVQVSPRRACALLCAITPALLLGACFLPLNMQGTTAATPLLDEPAGQRMRPPRRRTSAPPVQQGRLTVGDLVYALLRRNPQIEVLRLQKKVLAAGKDAVPRFKNPELRIMNLSSDIAQDKHGGLSLRLRWSPPFPGTYRARRAQAEARSQRDVQRLNLAVFQLIARARDLHAKLVITDRRLAVRRRLLALLRQRRDHQRRQVAVGTISQLKADLTELGTLDAKRRLAALVVTRARLHGQLRTMMRLKPGQHIFTGADLSVRPAALQSASALVRLTLTRHPSLAALDSRYRARHAALWLAKSKRYPWIDFVQAGYDLGEENLPARFQFGIGIRLPLLDLNSGQITRRRQQLKLVKFRRRILRRQLAEEVAARRLAVVAAQRALVHFRKTTRPKLDRILRRAVGAAKREGVDLNEVYRVRTLVTGFELARLDQLLAFVQAQIRLDLATARPVWRHYGIRLGNHQR